MTMRVSVDYQVAFVYIVISKNKTFLLNHKKLKYSVQNHINVNNSTLKENWDWERELQNYYNLNKSKKLKDKVPAKFREHLETDLNYI